MKKTLLILIGLLGLSTTALAGGYRYLEPADLKQWLETGKEMVIVDIQPAKDFARRHFPGAIETNSYPAKSDAERQRLDKAVATYHASPAEVVVVCPRGKGGAKRTYDYLKSKGVPEKKLHILSGGMDKWPYQEHQATEDGYGLMNTNSLKRLLDLNAAMTVVDARNREEYQEVHIKGAINIPEKKFAAHQDQLPSDKSARIIFYCNGVKCGKSKRAAEKALALGYNNVYVYAEGMPVWEEKGMPIYAGPDYKKRIETTKILPAALHDLITSEAETYTVVDVRDPGEFKEGHIPTAINIPVGTFASQSAVLDRNKRIIVYCNSGGRSYNAYRKLMKLSYKDICQAIFFDWKEAGLPVEKL